MALSRYCPECFELRLKFEFEGQKTCKRCRVAEELRTKRSEPSAKEPVHERR